MVDDEVRIVDDPEEYEWDGEEEGRAEKARASAPTALAKRDRKYPDEESNDEEERALKRRMPIDYGDGPSKGKGNA